MFNIITFIKKLFKAPSAIIGSFHKDLDYWPTNKEDQMIYGYYEKAFRSHKH